LVKKFDDGLNVIPDFLPLEPMQRAFTVAVNATDLRDPQQVCTRDEESINIHAIRLLGAKRSDG